jgi:hypothetical protein
MNLAPACPQLSLLEVKPSFDIRGNAHARNVYGSAAQDIVCKALGLDPIPINGSYETCFDAERNRHPFEIKSVRSGSKVVVYDWRIAKEARHPDLQYAVFIHRVKAATDFDDLIEQLTERPPRIAVTPATVIHALAAAEPLQTIKTISDNPRAGYQRKGYRDGYRNVPVSKILQRVRFVAMLDVSIFGARMDIELLS